MVDQSNIIDSGLCVDQDYSDSPELHGHPKTTHEFAWFSWEAPWPTRAFPAERPLCISGPPGVAAAHSHYTGLVPRTSRRAASFSQCSRFNYLESPSDP